MIKINKIEPLDKLSLYKTISDIEPDYIGRFATNSPLDYLKNAIKRYRRRNQTTQIIVQIKILEYLEKNFDNLLIGKPNDLYSVISFFATKGWQNLIYDTKASKFGIELLHIFGYSERFRNRVKRGIWLAKQLNIKSCPYCNAQYTIVAPNHKGSYIAKFQFDHFFSKDKYPYLCISLYNLIPSCVNCNITKSSRFLNLRDHYHPYFLDFSVYFKFRLKYDPDPKILTVTQVKKQNLEIELVPRILTSKSFVNAHNELYHIKGVYNRHQDIAEELLIKAIIYTQHLRSSHLKIKGLFPDKSTYLRYLIGTYPFSKDLLKRPLSKLIQDVANQLGLVQ